MNRRLQEKLIKMSYDLIDVPQSRFRHWTYICKRNKIIQMGWNFSHRSNPISKKFGYRFFDGLHSECHAVLSFPYDKSELRNYDFYNVRINNLGQVSLSKPCKHCQPMLRSHGVSNIWYTNEFGNFEHMEL